MMMIYCANNHTIYPSLKTAAIELKIDQGSISSQINGKRKTVGGYIFSKLPTKFDIKGLNLYRKHILYDVLHVSLDVDNAPKIWEGDIK